MIRIENLTKDFRTGDAENSVLHALRGVSFELTPSEIVAIVGPSGAGKSTLLHILGALDRPTEGKVLYEGQDLFRFSDERLAQFRNQHIGFVFQFHHLLPEFTVLENVAMPALIHGKEMADVKDEAMKLLHDVSVEAKAAARPAKLSGGEQQRVAIARALMNSPEVILADEPSGNLDTANAEQVHELMWNLSRTRGRTLVIVTHNIALARRADRIIHLKDGKIAEELF